MPKPVKEKGIAVPPERRRQKGAPSGQPVAEHEPPTYGNEGTTSGAAADSMQPGKAHGEKRPKSRNLRGG